MSSRRPTAELGAATRRRAGDELTVRAPSRRSRTTRPRRCPSAPAEGPLRTRRDAYPRPPSPHRPLQLPLQLLRAGGARTAARIRSPRRSWPGSSASSRGSGCGGSASPAASRRSARTCSTWCATCARRPGSRRSRSPPTATRSRRLAAPLLAAGVIPPQRLARHARPGAAPPHRRAGRDPRADRGGDRGGARRGLRVGEAERGGGARREQATSSATSPASPGGSAPRAVHRAHAVRAGRAGPHRAR